MKLTITFIVVTFGSMIASAAGSAVIPSLQTPPNNNALPKPPVANPSRIIRPPNQHWFAPHKPYRPHHRPLYGYPPRVNPGAPAIRPNIKRSVPEASVLTQTPPQRRPTLPPWLLTCGAIGGCGPNRYVPGIFPKQPRSIPEASVRTQTPPQRKLKLPPWLFTCSAIGGCGPNRYVPGILPKQPRSIPEASVLTQTPPQNRPAPLPSRLLTCGRIGGCGPNNYWDRMQRFRTGGISKRAPVIPVPHVCIGFNCIGTRPLPYRRPTTWPSTWTPKSRVNARSAEAKAEAEPEAFWCNPATGTGCGSGYRHKNGLGGTVYW